MLVPLVAENATRFGRGEISIKVYFVTAGRADEVAIIRKLKPPRILCSYWYFKNKPMDAFCESIGYVPEIMLDSGAYSAFTQGKNVNVLDYMDYILKNEKFLSNYIALDVIQNDSLTLQLYRLMLFAGLRPVPVFHYTSDPACMQTYIDSGARTVALGGTVPVRDKSIVAAWCESIAKQYPDLRFHLLGSSSSKIINCPGVDSCDSSTWLMMAANGYPKTIPGTSREAKRARGEANMIEIMEKFNDNFVSSDNRSI